MRRGLAPALILSCFSALFLTCYGPALFRDRQFAYRDAANYYYPLNKRVQAEWNAGRWPLWEPEENAGMPLLGNPTAAVLYPGKLVFALLPYAWGARSYVVAHSALAFLSMLSLMRSWGTSWFGAALSALSYAFGAPILFQHCNIIYLIGAAWLPWGVHAVDGWARLGRRWCLLELALVLSMQVLGGDPQSAYLLGLSGIGYAAYLAWNRATLQRQPLTRSQADRKRRGFSPLVLAIVIVLWWALTLVLAQWLPKLRAPGKPPPPLHFVRWVPLCVNLAWGLAAVGFLVFWRRRGWRFPLGVTLLGLAGSAALAASLSAAQLLPVIEFSQQTGRSATIPHERYAYTLEPCRLIELAWPNILGMPLEGKSYWGDAIRMPGGRPKGWVPSLYVGALTLALAFCSLTLPAAPPWRVWLASLGGVSLLASLGQYTSPIWMGRAADITSSSTTVHGWLAGLGPMDPNDYTAIRPDGYLRDCDGGFYWWLATLLPGFSQFRYPAKLFTLTALAIAALAGSTWDHLCARRGRATAAVCLVFTVLTMAALAGVIVEKEGILTHFQAIKSPSTFGPLEPAAGYLAIIHSLGQATIVFGVGVLLTVLAPKRPRLAGSAALILTTADLAAANSRYILTVPQSLFETRPEAQRAIDDAERADPCRGPFRIHRMQQWYPANWAESSSEDRISEHVSWDRDTLYPKYGLDYGDEYTYAKGVAQLRDYDPFFGAIYTAVRDRQLATSLGIAVGTPVLYFPRRAFDMWNTRYFIVPFGGKDGRDPLRGSASFVFNSKQVYPDPTLFIGPEHGQRVQDWIRTRDFKVIRNLVDYPRSWIVHDARATIPVMTSSRAEHGETMEEILYAGDGISNRATHHAYDPRNLAWISHDELLEIRPYLSGRPTNRSEMVTVTYPNPQQAVLEAKLDSPGLVVLADVYYPGWELIVDGKPAPVYRVNMMMRGAAVPAGEHRLVYTYKPLSVRLGRLASIAGLAALAILAWACGRWPLEPVVAGNPRLRSGNHTVSS